MTAIYISALGGTLPYGPRLGTASLSDLIRCFTRLGDARLETSKLWKPNTADLVDLCGMLGLDAPQTLKD